MAFALVIVVCVDFLLVGVCYMFVFSLIGYGFGCFYFVFLRCLLVLCCLLIALFG